MTWRRLAPWVIGAIALIALLIAVPRRFHKRSRPLRAASLTLTALLTLANGWSAALLVIGLVAGTEGEDAGPLLAAGAAIWLTNVIAFALWYWQLDGGGPVARPTCAPAARDFLFPQQQEPALAASGWRPLFIDYLYVSFTNATAFSPTDAMPLSRWAKMLMLVQSAISLALAVMVVARAVNILRTGNEPGAALARPYLVANDYRVLFKMPG